MEEKKSSILKKSEMCGIKGYIEAIYPLFLIIFLGFLLSSCEKNQFSEGTNNVPELAGISDTYPANLSESAYVDDAVSVTFKAGTDPSVVASAKITVNNGTQPVPGVVSVAGMKASFTASADLKPENEYNASVTIKSGTKDGKYMEYSWKFKTGKHHGYSSLEIVSVNPADKTAEVPVASTVTVTFNKELTDYLKNRISVSLSEGTKAVAGTLTYTGSTATLKPTSALTDGTLYTGRVIIGPKDGSAGDDDDKSGKPYSWTFTTAGIASSGGSNTDTTAPTVISVTPLSNATAVPIASGMTATFSEAMDPSTITSSTFTLQQGSNPVAGTVTYSGTTATFKPSAALTQNTVYTATITTGAKDVAGNAITASYTWSFTTEAVVATAGMSFANDVIPVLQLCNNCHTHPWTTSPVASTYYTNLVNGGYINPTSPTTSKIYIKLSGGHPATGVSSTDKNKVLAWITEGCKNN